MKEKLLLEVKLTEKKAALTPETKQPGRKRNIAFRDTIPALSVYYKGSFNEKVESNTRPTTTVDKILKNHLKCNFFEKGKLWQRTCLLEPKYKRDRCAACHPLQFFTKSI